MKRRLIIISLLISVLVGCAPSIHAKVDPKKQRELLKEYFLCKCIYEGFGDLPLNEYDLSQSVYFDIGRYAPEAFKEVSDYAREFVKSIEPAIIDDLGHKKAIIMVCVDKYNSKELDRFIRSMDKYMYKE